MIKIGREVRNGSQLTSSRCRGPDVRVKDRPGHYSVNKKADLFAVGLRFPALFLPKASNGSLHPLFPGAQLTISVSTPADLWSTSLGRTRSQSHQFFPGHSIFSFDLEVPLKQKQSSLITLHHHWVWEGSYLY